MGGFRKNRVSELMRQVISDLIRDKIKDPRIIGVTITEVKMADDLKSAIVYFASLADGKHELHLEGLQAAEGFLRRQLRGELDLKYIPVLSFHYDTSFDNYDRISRLLKKVEPPGTEDDE
ncbi:MAG: 30S ribosome-binding factor RbfA [Pseudomonadota bacterium]